MTQKRFELIQGGQPTELDAAEDMEMQYYQQHGRMAPQVSGMTADELRERIDTHQHLLETAGTDEKTAAVLKDEVSFMQDLANRLSRG